MSLVQCLILGIAISYGYGIAYDFTKQIITEDACHSHYDLSNTVFVVLTEPILFAYGVILFLQSRNLDSFHGLAAKNIYMIIMGVALVSVLIDTVYNIVSDGLYDTFKLNFPDNVLVFVFLILVGSLIGLILFGWINLNILLILFKFLIPLILLIPFMMAMMVLCLARSVGSFVVLAEYGAMIYFIFTYVSITVTTIG